MLKGGKQADAGNAARCMSCPIVAPCLAVDFKCATRRAMP